MRARRASGGREGELLQRAGRLRKDPQLLLPKLSRDCPSGRFDKLRAALEEVHDARDDADRLGRLARRGDPLARALAGLLKFYLDEELPGLLVARLPSGEISFAPLAKAPRESQIAVQQYDHPERLLLGYLAWARKGYHFFAAGKTLYCTGPSPAPPEEFRHAFLSDLPYRLDRGKEAGTVACPHLLRGEPVPYLEVAWPGASMRFRVCRECARDDRQLLAALTSRLAVPKPEKAFPVAFDLNVDCRSKEACVHAALPTPSRRLRKQYLFGRVSDARALDDYRKELAPRLDAGRGPRFEAAGVCYGADLGAFVTALSPTPAERKALEEALPSVAGAFEIPEAKASQALERLWHEHAQEIVRAIVPEAARAEQLVRDARAAPGRVSELLHRAARETQERELLAKLPRLEHLVPAAALADRVARAYRVGGREAAVKLLLGDLPREGKERGLGFGLLIALEQEGGQLWQFTPTEQEFGRSLAERASKLLHAEPDAYASALGELLGAAGVTDWGVVLSDSS